MTAPAPVSVGNMLWRRPIPYADAQRAVVCAAVLALAMVCAQPSAAEPQPFARTERHEPCANYNPLRNPYFGDLHVHTALSLDASTQGTRAMPADAYRFARGEPLGVQPYAGDGTPLRRLRLNRPLDFAAVTDHAELFRSEEHTSELQSL